MTLINLCFIILFFSVPFIVHRMLKYAQLSLFEFSIPSWVIVNMFVFAYIGILPLFFGWDQYRKAIGITNQALILQIFLFSSLAIITMCVGFIWGDQLFKLVNFKLHFKSKKAMKPLKKNEVICLLLLFSICVGVLFVYLTKIPKIAFFVALMEGVKDAKLARSDMGNNFAGKYHWYDLFMHQIMNFCAFSFFANWVLKKNKMTTILFVLSLSFACFSAVMSTEKGPIIHFFIALLIIYIVSINKGVYPVKKIVAVGLILYLLLVSLYLNFMGSRDFASASTSIFSRIFTGQIAPVYYYFEFFPRQHEFLSGRSFPNPKGILPFKCYPLPSKVWAWKFPDLARSGIVGTVPTVFWGEMYANFGILGILFSPIVVGGGIFFLAKVVDCFCDDPLKVGLTAWLTVHLSFISGSGLSGYVMDEKLWLVIFSYILLKALSNNGILKIKGFSYTA